MNREERRRRDKAQQGRTSGQRAVELKAAMDDALLHHRTGHYAQAEALYRQILQIDSRHAEALHLLGLLTYQLGRLDQAGTLIEQAIREQGSNPGYHFNLGVVRQKQGRWSEASAAYQAALRLNPRYAEAHCNLGNLYREQGGLEAALDAYRRAIEAKPGYVDAFNNMGVALEELGRFREAADAYGEALRLNPQHVEAHCNLGNVLREQGLLDEAVRSASRALTLKPDYAKGHYNLAFAYLWQGRLAEAQSEFARSAELKQNHGRPMTGIQLYRSRIKHDLEQVRYLQARGLLPPGFEEYVGALERAGTMVQPPAGELNRVTVDADTAKALLPSFTRLLHVAPPARLSEGALNAKLDVMEIEARWNASRPEILWVDQLVSEPALAALRTFCLESTIWKKDYENGYVGALLGDGFASPLLLQLSEELRLKFPGIFKHHRLRQAWAFKCDSAMRGLNMHADAAAVNVNFWITPDEANLDPDHGGLIVWDKEAPKEWNFREYNSSAMEPKILAFLEQSGANAVTVPYRANRAVIFNSDLFHKTDRISFKEGYENRRINITLLYGKRSE